jgi:hypothetical protein
MSTFIPYLIVSVGATGAFYTLRETYEDGRGKIRSFHHFNLAQDADEAYEKALAYSHNNGIPMKSTRDQMTDEMREILRATAEQRAERQLKLEREIAEHAALLKRMHDEKVEMINNGLIPFGKYHGQAFRSPYVPFSYIQWVITGKFDDNSIIKLLQDKIKSDCPDFILPLPDKDIVVGTVGKRETFNVTITRLIQINGYYGISYICCMVTDDGACIVSKGAFADDLGKHITIKATVKEHSRYNGQMQTIVQRVAIAK